MRDLRHTLSRSHPRRSLRCLLIIATLFVSITGHTPAQQAADGQVPKPAASAPAQAGTKKTPETASTPAPPAVTDPHQAQIVADTQKLVKLSEELKAEVAKSNKDTLSLAVIKKAEEVEKQAKTLKDELSKSR